MAADIFTKFVKAELLQKHFEYLRWRLEEQRAESVLQNNGLILKDEWLEQGPAASGRWTRAHNRPRLCPFTPMRVARGPSAGEQVGDIRVTYGTFDDGTKAYREDLWKTTGSPHEKLEQHWTGVTSFRHP